jgi:hypothetical protein
MVCGGPAQPCAPLTFCDKCRGTPEAEAIRQRHSEFIEKLVAERKKVENK